MRHVLMISKDSNICIAKCINYNGNLQYNEVDITEEQYNQINEFPLLLTLDENGEVISWLKTELPYEEPIIVPLVPTSEERISALEAAMNFMLGM